MRVALWLHEFFDRNDRPLVGGVQTYVLELSRAIRSAGMDPVLIVAHRRAFESAVGGIPVEAVVSREWSAGISGDAAKRRKLNQADCIHVVANAHGVPKRLGPRSIAIQHGIYWDRPASRASALTRIAPRAANLIRCWRGASIINRFAALVCVDLVFPTMAACVYTPLPWERIHYIPNFAPDVAERPELTADIRRVVFSRRLVPHRGTRLFAEALLPLLREGWSGEVHIVGNGPDEGFLREVLADFSAVRFYELPCERRMEAYTEDSLVIIPSLSTEGTSLSCVEAWSRGALVLATGVGGLSNLVLHNHNGLLARPVADDLAARTKEALHGDVGIPRLKKNGFETFQHGFTRSIWQQKWLQVLADF